MLNVSLKTAKHMSVFTLNDHFSFVFYTLINPEPNKYQAIHISAPITLNS